MVDSEKGFAHGLLILAVFGVVALMALSNLQLAGQFKPQKADVAGALIARGGDEHSGPGSSVPSSMDNDSSGPNNSGASSPGGSPGPSGSANSSPNPEVDKRAEEKKAEQAKVELGGDLHESTDTSKLLRNRDRGKAEETKVRVKSKDGSEVEIEAAGNKFKLTVQGQGVDTNFPITFDKTTSQLFVQIGTGLKEIRILPNQASEIARQAGIQNKLSDQLVEATSSATNDSLAFKVTGTRTGKFLGLIPISAELEAEVGAQSGQILKVNQPFWLKLLSPFIF